MSKECRTLLKVTLPRPSYPQLIRPIIINRLSCFSCIYVGKTSTNQEHDHEFIESESMQQSILGDPLSVLGMSLETNRCKPNQTYIWCLPFDYNQEKHPFTCKIQLLKYTHSFINDRK